MRAPAAERQVIKVLQLSHDGSNMIGKKIK